MITCEDLKYKFLFVLTALKSVKRYLKMTWLRNYTFPFCSQWYSATVRLTACSSTYLRQNTVALQRSVRLSQFYITICNKLHSRLTSVTGIKQWRFCLNIGPNYVEVRVHWVQPSCASFPLSVLCFTLSAHENNTEMSLKIPPKLKTKFSQNNDKNEWRSHNSQNTWWASPLFFQW